MVIAATKDSLRIIKLISLLVVFISANAVAKEQYACFWFQNAPPVKLTLEGSVLTIDHPRRDQIPAYTESMEMLALRTPEDQQLPSIAPCTLIQNVYTLGVMSRDYCWKESTQQLWVGNHDFREDAEYETASGTAVYNCIKID